MAVFHLDESQGLPHARFYLFLAHAFLAQAIGDIVGDAQGIEKGPFLKHKSDLSAECKQFVLGHAAQVVCPARAPFPNPAAKVPRPFSG